MKRDADPSSTAIREELPEDAPAVRRVIEAAFGRREEADVVDELRRACPGLLSLVAVREGQVVGHILFSPATIEGPHGPVRGMGLAPLAVLPEVQGTGAGSRLVRSGLSLLRARPCPFVIVLGHPGYYPRFGFEPASRHGIQSQWPGVPDDAFLIAVLDRIEMRGVSGVARYRDEFDSAV
jgi:putative acetyltransferase